MIKISQSLYTKEVLLKTAYLFTDRVYIHIEKDDDYWIVSWIPKGNHNIDAKEFENELIFQALRKTLLEKTAEIRKIILARAFASTVVETNSNDIIEQKKVTKEENALPKYDPSEDEKAEILRGWFDLL